MSGRPQQKIPTSNVLWHACSALLCRAAAAAGAKRKMSHTSHATRTAVLMRTTPTLACLSRPGGDARWYTQSAAAYAEIASAK